MVYTGKPSAGCSACRKRRIKCDEAKPTCSYCTKKQIICLQPKSQFDVIWRDQNTVASKSVQRRVKARKDTERDNDQDTPGSSTSSSSSSSSQHTSTPISRSKPHSPDSSTDLDAPIHYSTRTTPSRSIDRPLPQDTAHYALSFFFTTYVLPVRTPDIQRGILDCLWPVWVLTNPNSPLVPAVKAVAFALLEAWSFLNPNAHDSLGRAYYVAGMEAVRRCIGGVEGGGRGVADAVDAVDAVDDDVLMATLMLDMYDGISAFTGSKPRQSPHLDGGRALIESRKRLSSNNEISQRILLGVRSQVVARAMETGESVRVMEGRLYESGDGVREKVGSPDFALGRLELELAEVQGAVRALRAGVDTLGPWNSCFDRAWELLARVRELDCRLVDWYDTIPEAWVPVTIWATGGGGISDSIGAAGLYQSHCTVHESVFIANMLNGHACTRIKVQLLLLDCLELIDADQVSFGDDFEASHSIVSMRETAKSIVQDLADAICASIPFHLGDRNEALRIDDTSVQYPRIGISLLPQEHYITAAAHGGIFLITKLTQLLSLGPLLREGQREWILGQMGRIKRIYRAPSVIVGSC